MGFIEINEEQKIRISLSTRARIVMAEDMEVFQTPKESTFINTVFHNYKFEASSSVSLYLEQRKLELEQLFAESALDDTGKKAAIDQLLSFEEQEVKDKIAAYNSAKGEGKLYHINDDNIIYLVQDCEEERYYKRPGQYMRSVVEEYCSLPFIERERIYRKDIYDTVEQACREKRILKVKADYYGKEQVFYVYPYKIVPDTFHTQSYLVCYSRKEGESDKDKIVASFSMARLSKPSMLIKKFYLNQSEIREIEFQIAKYSPAYLVGKPELITVRLTKKGKDAYRTRLYSRPEKIDVPSEDDIYTFNCTPLQIYNYFFSFGADAEIISPESLRNRFKNSLTKAIENYKVSYF